MPKPSILIRKKGCAYDGDVGKDGKPSGKGIWKCQDGRSYVGTFKNGKFDGKGAYTVSGNRETFIEPFSSNSAKLRNMTLEGMFKKGKAHGNFTASQNGTPIFIMKCEDGMIKEVKLHKNLLPKPNKQPFRRPYPYFRPSETSINKPV